MGRPAKNSFLKRLQIFSKRIFSGSREVGPRSEEAAGFSDICVTIRRSYLPTRGFWEKELSQDVMMRTANEIGSRHSVISRRKRRRCVKRFWENSAEGKQGGRLA